MAWMPSHCAFKLHDRVDETAKESMLESPWSYKDQTTLWKKDPIHYDKLNINIELQVALRILKRSSGNNLAKRWRANTYKSFAKTVFDDGKELPKTHTTTHPNSRITSRVNRLRTGKTIFQQKHRKTNIRCNNCPPNKQCTKCKKITIYTHQWGNCACGAPNSVEHIMDHCPRVTLTRDLLQNFLRRTALTAEQKRTHPPQHYTFNYKATLGNIKFSKESRAAFTRTKLAQKANEYTHRHRNAYKQEVWLPSQHMPN